METNGIAAGYEAFVNKNIEGYEIIKKYCEELTESPYEELLPTDVTMGRWLEDSISSLSGELLPMIGELTRFKIDISVLDIYRNLLMLVGKRYALLVTLVDSHHLGPLL